MCANVNFAAAAAGDLAFGAIKHVSSKCFQHIVLKSVANAFSLPLP